jgi:hypothetical protein
MYYTLLIREDGRWSAQFGDFNQWVVREEKKDWKFACGTLNKDMRIITTTENQEEINKVVNQFNRS